MVRRALLLCLLALAAPSAAGAATLTIAYERTIPADYGDSHNPPTKPVDLYRMSFTDTGAERNRVAVSRSSIRDDGAPIEPGPGCRVDAQGSATCSATPARGHTVGFDILLSTGAGDDTVAIDRAPTDLPVALDLGDGDDAATVHRVSAIAGGGAGADSLTASGPDTSVLWDGGPGADATTGDRVVATYAGRTAPVHVTPDGLANDGSTGEGDNVGTDVETIIGGDGDDDLASGGRSVDGGPGDDVIAGAPPVPDLTERLNGDEGNDTITGGAGRQAIRGGPGDDRLSGGDGDDFLDDGPGADVVDGGAGNDTLEDLDDGAADDFTGGPGFDGWAGNGRPISVSLDDVANDGTAGEGDDVRADWEAVRVLGGTLVGSDGAQHLTMTGEGTIDGRGGDDLLIGGTNVIGGAGRDEVRLLGGYGRPRRVRADLRDGEADRIGCGVPLTVLRRDPDDHVDGCFAVATVRPVEPLRSLGAQTVAVVRIACPGPQRCRGVLTVRAEGPPHVLLGRVPYDLAAGQARRRAIRVGRHARALRRACGYVYATTVTRSPFQPGQVARRRESYALGPGRAVATCRR